MEKVSHFINIQHQPFFLKLAIRENARIWNTDHKSVETWGLLIRVMTLMFAWKDWEQNASKLGFRTKWQFIFFFEF